MYFNERLGEVCSKRNSHVCVGLDIDLDKIPQFILNETRPLVYFSEVIIKATAGYVAAFKVNTAFFEAYGVLGWAAMSDIVKAIPSGIIKIADAKRNDIGNSAKRYAKAFFEELGFDAITVNPYLGYDGILPFIQNKEKGAFILCITSNKGSDDFQKMNDGSQFLYERVANKVFEWDRDVNCGLVTGATHSDELKRIRTIAPGLPFLVPGIGAQGGDLKLSVKYTFTGSGIGIFNSSRNIIYASNKENFAEVAAQKALELRDSINKLRT